MWSSSGEPAAGPRPCCRCLREYWRAWGETCCCCVGSKQRWFAGWPSEVCSAARQGEPWWDPMRGACWGDCRGCGEESAGAKRTWKAVDMGRARARTRRAPDERLTGRVEGCPLRCGFGTGSGRRQMLGDGTPTKRRSRWAMGEHGTRRIRSGAESERGETTASLEVWRGHECD